MVNATASDREWRSGSDGAVAELDRAMIALLIGFSGNCTLGGALSRSMTSWSGTIYK